MQPRLSFRYYATALLLGIGWFPVLSISPLHRQFLLVNGSLTYLISMVFLSLTSLVIAIIFRRFIVGAKSWRSDSVRALVLPLAGCLVYVSLLNTYSCFQAGRMFQHDQLVLYVWSIAFTILWLPLVFPYGLVCQRLMRLADS